MSTTSLSPTSGRRRPNVGAIAGAALARYGLVVVFVAVAVGFSIANPDIFPTWDNAKTIATTQAVIALLALAAMLPLVVGQFDISVGFQLGLAQGLCAGLIVKQGLPAGLAVAITLAVGAGVGLINGLLVVRLRMSAFIATLGTGTLVLGATQLYTKDEAVTGAFPSSFLAIGRNDVLGIPVPLLIVLAACAVLWLALEYTAWGRSAFAAGSNPRAALLAGVRVERVTIQAFIGAGLLAAMAGSLSVMTLGSAHPSIGLNLLLPAFAGAFLGATSIRPGRFNAIGTVLAVYVLAMGVTGLQQLGAAFYVEQFFDGGALLLAVAVSGWAAQRRRASAS
jgi:ribose transport system permease protein